MSQYDGPNGRIGTSMRYLSQRFAMPNRTATAVLNDVGTEELAHLEMVSTIVPHLTRDLSMEEEVVHFQCFVEALRSVQEQLNVKISMPSAQALTIPTRLPVTAVLPKGTAGKIIKICCLLRNP